MTEPNAPGSGSCTPPDEAGETIAPVAHSDASVTHALRSGLGIRGDVSLTMPEILEDLLSRSGSGNRYAVIGEVARGGMGAIVKILDTDIRRPVAMKVMLCRAGDGSGGRGAGGIGERERLERFVEEAQVTGQLEHPNIVPVHELGLDDDGRLYFTMKLVRGESLESILEGLADRDPALTERYPLSHLLQIFLKICDAVSFAHSKGVLHRDLKPENVMVGAFGEVLLMDWGLAKVLRSPDRPYGASRQADQPDHEGVRENGQEGLRNIGSGQEPIEGLEKEESGHPADQVDQSPPKPSLSGSRAKADQVNQAIRTLEGDVFGTPAYMPPEQAAGRVSEVDERSDVFALGAILYKILTYEAPYDGESVTAILSRAVETKFKPPRRRTPWNRIPAELESVCLKAMAPKKRERYGTAEALVRDVRAFMDRRPVSAHRYGPLTRLVRFVQRHPAGSLAGSVALVLIALGSALAGILLSRAESSAAQAREQEARALAERSRAEAESLRAEKAEVEREVAEDRADLAEDALAKGRKVSAVLRAAEVELGDVLKSLRGIYFSRMPRKQRQALTAPFLVQVDAIEASIPSDSASRATWLACKGWTRHLAGFQEEALRLFDASRRTDPDVAYGALFEGMGCFTDYILSQALPPLVMTVSGLEFRFEDIPKETARMRKARLRLVELLSMARRASVWGETSAREFAEVLEGFRAMQSGDLETADRGLSKALGISEMAWHTPQILIARCKVRYLSGDFEAGLRDIETVLEELPDCSMALLYEGDLRVGVGLRMESLGRAPLETYRRAIASLNHAIELDPEHWNLRQSRVLALIKLAAARIIRREEPEDELKTALSDLTELIEDIPERSAFINRAETRRLLSVIVSNRLEDPRKLLQEALEDCDAAIEIGGKKPDVLVIRSGIFLVMANEDLMRGEGEPEKWLRAALADLDEARTLEPDWYEIYRQGANAHMNIAVFLAKSGREYATAFEKATNRYREIQERRPDWDLPRTDLGKMRVSFAQSLIRLGKDPSAHLEGAIQDFTEALERNRESAIAFRIRGVARMKLSEAGENRGMDPGPLLESALSDLDEALRIDPAMAEALNQRAEVQLRFAERALARGGEPRTQLEKAIEDAGKALEITPADVNALRIRGRAYRRLADTRKGEDAVPYYEKAMAACEEALRIRPQYWEALEEKATTQLLLGKYLFIRGKVEAMDLFRQGIETASAGIRNAPNLGVLYLARARCWSTLGLALEARRQDPVEAMRKAVNDFTEALRCSPDSFLAYNGRGYAQKDLGRVLSQRGEDPGGLFEKSVEDFGEALKRNPGFVHALLNRAMSRLFAGNHAGSKSQDPFPHYEKAVEDCREALRMDPSFAQAFGFMGMTYQDWGDALQNRGKDPKDTYWKALQAYSDSIRRRGTSYGDLNGLGNAYQSLARAESTRGREFEPFYEKALVVYREALKANPASWQCMSNSARILMNLGRFSEALEMFDRIEKTVRPFPESLVEDRARSRLAAKSAEWVQALLTADQAVNRGDFRYSRPLYEKAVKLGAEEKAEEDETWKTHFARSHFQLACLCAFASVGRLGLNAEEQAVPVERAAEERKKCLEYLKASFRLGFRNLDLVRTQQCFDPLRETPEFKAFIEEWEGK